MRTEGLARTRTRHLPTPDGSRSVSLLSSNIARGEEVRTFIQQSSNNKLSRLWLTSEGRVELPEIRGNNNISSRGWSACQCHDQILLYLITQLLTDLHPPPPPLPVIISTYKIYFYLNLPLYPLYYRRTEGLDILEYSYTQLTIMNHWGNLSSSSLLCAIFPIISIFWLSLLLNVQFEFKILHQIPPSLAKCV